MEEKRKMYNKNCDNGFTDLKQDRKGGGNFMQQTWPTSQIHENQCTQLIGEFHVLKLFCLLLVTSVE
jgi:hypothetical protein